MRHLRVPRRHPGSEPVGRPLLPFAALVLAILGATVAAVLLMSSVLATESFRLYQLKQSNAELDRTALQLQEEVHGRGSLANLREQAEEQGLVPAGPPGFVRLADGTVLGDPPPATPPPPVRDENSDDTGSDDTGSDDTGSDDTGTGDTGDRDTDTDETQGDDDD